MKIEKTLKDVFFSKKSKKIAKNSVHPEIEMVEFSKPKIDSPNISNEGNTPTVNEKLAQLSVAELAAKAAYLLSANDLAQVNYTKKCLSDQGYQVHTIFPSKDASINEKAKSIYIYALVPTDKNKAPIISCRGTDFSDIHSTVHNIDPQGPAHNAINSVAEVILSNIADTCGEHTALNITGHSQGGSIAQLLYTKILNQKALAHASEYAEAGETYLPKLSNLGLQVFQSAGVNDEVFSTANNAAKKVAQSGIHLSADYFVRSWDIVTLSGNKILVSDDITPEIATVSLRRVTEKSHLHYMQLDEEDYSLKSIEKLAKDIIKKPSLMNVIWQLGKKVLSPFKKQAERVALEAHTKPGFLEAQLDCMDLTSEFVAIVNGYTTNPTDELDAENAIIEQYSNENMADRTTMATILNRDLTKMDPSGMLKKSQAVLHAAVAGKSMEEITETAVNALGGATVATGLVAGALAIKHLYDGSTGILTVYNTIQDLSSVGRAVQGIDGTVKAIQAVKGLTDGVRQLGFI
jgi:predicted esterase